LLGGGVVDDEVGEGAADVDTDAERGGCCHGDIIVWKVVSSGQATV
jgi:hypothetical protein